MIAKIFLVAVVVYTDHRFNPIVLCASVRQSTIYHPQSTTTIGELVWMEPWKINKIVPMVLPLDICVLADHYSHHYHYHYLVGGGWGGGGGGGGVGVGAGGGGGGGGGDGDGGGGP